MSDILRIKGKKDSLSVQLKDLKTKTDYANMSPEEFVDAVEFQKRLQSAIDYVEKLT
jgi:hypothetical protein